MYPFDLPPHHEKNHLNKQGWCKFIALIWILLLCFSCWFQNPEDLFRITQTLNMSKCICHIFHSASRTLSTVSPWQYKHKCNLLAGNLSLQKWFNVLLSGRSPALQSIKQCVCVFSMQFWGFCLYLIWKQGEWCTLKVPSIKPGILWWRISRALYPRHVFTVSLSH